VCLIDDESKGEITEYANESGKRQRAALLRESEQIAQIPHSVRNDSEVEIIMAPETLS